MEAALPSATPLEHACYWRQRTAEIRAQANETHDPSVKQMLLEAAESYERLAEMAQTEGQGEIARPPHPELAIEEK
jgi:hypothetical protein